MALSPAVSLLVLVVGSLLAADAWAVLDAKIAVTAAAREAARAYVEAADAPAAAEAADAAGRQALTGHGRDPTRLHLRVDHLGAVPWGRCVRVTVRAAYAVPAVSVPWLGERGDAFEVVGTHSELVDPHRSGLPGGC